MKNIGYLLLIFAFTLIIYSGCDSATDSKPISVSAPVLVSPPDTAINVSRTPTFTWTGSADKLQIGSNNTFSTIVVQATVTGTTYTVPANSQLAANKLYFWRAGVTAGSTVYWCTNIFSFTTGP